ncbi:unnamed protein product [Cyclocybe aegerita]|uniref:Uncharacterized protein n=1 Tax=Cyclocybe aegerita TaxID=1973307 RepID=A0A8S0W0G6_CYCAE|nr:unnamed protein product [Cyclocybe aegerita]
MDPENTTMADAHDDEQYVLEASNPKSRSIFRHMPAAQERELNNANHSEWEWEDDFWTALVDNNPWVQLKNQWAQTPENEIPNVIKTPPRFKPTLSFLVRDSYKELFDRIWYRGFAHPRTGVLITGQPGIGKTTFLWYTLIRLLNRRQPVLFVRNWHLILFFHDGVFTTPRSNLGRACLPTPPADEADEGRCRAFIWTLLELDGAQGEPETSLLEDPCFPVQASSPNPKRYSKWVRVSNAAKWGLPLWDKVELMQGLELQQRLYQFQRNFEPYLPISPKNIPLERSARVAHGILLQRQNEDEPIAELKGAFSILVDDAIEEYGLAARDIYAAIFAPAELADDHKVVLHKACYEFLKLIVEQLWDETMAYPEAGDRIFCAYPSPETSTDSPRSLWLLNFKSTRIAKRVMEQLRACAQDRLEELYTAYRVVPGLSVLVGWFFEALAVRYLICGQLKNMDLAEMRRPSDGLDNAPTFKIDLPPSSKCRVSLPMARRSDCILELSEKFNRQTLPTGFRSRCFYIPDASNNPLFDALFVEESTDNTALHFVLWMFQATTGVDHKGLREGYSSAQKVMLALNKSAQAVSKVVRFEIRYVLIFPEDNKRTTASWHMPEGWTEKLQSLDHREKVYYLDIPIPVCALDPLAFLTLQLDFAAQS